MKVASRWRNKCYYVGTRKVENKREVSRKPRVALVFDNFSKKKGSQENDPEAVDFYKALGYSSDRPSHATSDEMFQCIFIRRMIAHLFNKALIWFFLAKNFLENKMQLIFMATVFYWLLFVQFNDQLLTHIQNFFIDSWTKRDVITLAFINMARDIRSDAWNSTSHATITVTGTVVG